jgi:uncharacterized protein YdaU (DUF1376 family)
MKKRNPYFNFYPADFMNGVRGLSPQEVGVYTMLLCRIYEEDGPVEYHVRRLATYCNMREATFEKVVETLVDLGKITLSDGRLSNPRAEAEISKRSNGLEIASRAGKASAEKRQQNQRQGATTVQQPFNHTDTDTDKYSVAKATDGEAIGAQGDLAKELFERGVRFLGKHGVKETQARSIIGRWRKEHQDSDILSAFMDCAKSGAIDPIPWITARLVPPATFKPDFSKYGVS